MAKLIWGADGERTFEAGVDRGVLYVPGLVGVAWNGLKAVKEAPSGGEPQPFYLDGMKYANVSSAEEFNATLEAFSSPTEFAGCDGSVYLAAGLLATQQPRKSFGLSYRTLVGDDISGLKGGYKIHIVYNALASSSGRENHSMGNTVKTTELSWDISTRPPKVAFGFKPTAHFVIDSRKTPKGLLAYIEDVLYGSPTVNPSLIGVNELVALFSGPGPNVYRNLLTNPSFEVGSGVVEVRRNYVIDPNLTSLASWTTTTAAGYSMVLVAGGIQIDMSTNTNIAPALFPSLNMDPGVVGDQWTGLLEVSVPVGFPTITLYHRIYSYGQNAIVGDSGAVIIKAGETKVLIARSILGVATGTTGIRTVLYSTATAGSRMVVSRIMAEKARLPGTYFSGETSFGGDFTYAWVGAVNSSASVQRAVGVTGVTSYQGANGYLSKEWSNSGQCSLRITSGKSGGAGNSAVYLSHLFKAETTYTIVAKMRMIALHVSSTPIYARSIRLVGDTTLNGHQLPNAIGVQEYRWTFKDTSSFHSIQLWNGSPQGDADVWWDDLTIIEGTYNGAIFNGDTQDTLDDRFEWEGVPHASISKLSSWNKY